MPTLLVKNARLLATMDGARREILNGGMFIEDGFIKQVGKSEQLPDSADELLDLSDHLVIPGLINTHHHFYQTLTRVVPDVQDVNLFHWLKTLYPIWARMTPEDIYISTKTALAELALSIYSPMVHGWMTRSRQRVRWACACMPHADRCLWVSQRAGCRRTRLWMMRMRSSVTHSA